ncbi:MAG: ferrochelatase [Thermoguttaceae bacterium]|nr:ferrochelatase [Thermoguttaceae bacterium]
MMYFDAFFLVSYGGPEGPDEVHPFLDRILDGKYVSEARRKIVVDKYMACGGFSPLNGQCRQFMLQLDHALQGKNVRTYQANLFSPPFVPDVVKRMKNDGVRRVLLLISSPFGSVAGCRRYLDVIERNWPADMELTRIPCFYDHPLYLKAAANQLLSCAAQVILNSSEDAFQAGTLQDRRQSEYLSTTEPRTLFLFTAHSLPVNQAQDARYSEQLGIHCREVLRLTHLLDERQLAPAISKLAFQSRSGNPRDPWTEPDIFDAVIELHDKYPSLKNIIVTPCGFCFENMEITWDIDIELKKLCQRLHLNFYRTDTPGTSDEMIQMCVEYLGMSRDSFRFCPCSPGICDFSCSDLPNTTNIS